MITDMGLWSLVLWNLGLPALARAWFTSSLPKIFDVPGCKFRMAGI
ncbi:MAG: hypothetical protein JJU28_17650 [Cyclobacteriaceae bacterium]|nr:hypothetical protein [Cyclobacteriaceae bacterium]